MHVEWIHDMKQKTLTLLGAGTMGTGIAQLFAQCGFNVTLIDNLQAQLDIRRCIALQNPDFQFFSKSLPHPDRFFLNTLLESDELGSDNTPR